jgi:hypothetical protein
LGVLACGAQVLGAAPPQFGEADISEERWRKLPLPASSDDRVPCHPPSVAVLV